MSCEKGAITVTMRASFFFISPIYFLDLDSDDQCTHTVLTLVVQAQRICKARVDINNMT